MVSVSISSNGVNLGQQFNTVFIVCVQENARSALVLVCAFFKNQDLLLLRVLQKLRSVCILVCVFQKSRYVHILECVLQKSRYVSLLVFVLQKSRTPTRRDQQKKNSEHHMNHEDLCKKWRTHLGGCL